MELTPSSMLRASLSMSSAVSSNETHRLPKVPVWLDQAKKCTVQLYVYDMMKGLGPAFSALFSEFDFETLWHTSIVVFGHEYSYGKLGMQVGTPNEPLKIIDLGWTHISKRTLYECLVNYKNHVFKPELYDIFHRNCNSFSEELCQVLTGQSIPYEYRTFGQRMYDKCVHHYNINSQKQLLEYIRTRPLCPLK